MANETILVVDDEKEIRNLITIYLKNEGYKVLQAGDGEEGLRLLEENEVHLVVLDIMMPKVDGIHMYESKGRKRNANYYAFRENARYG